MSEAKKAQAARIAQPHSMWSDYLYEEFFVRGPGLDIGYRGAKGAEPMFSFSGLELGDSGYDGKTAPYPDESFATVHASHVLEHIPEPLPVLRDWFRLLVPGGHLILTVPHKYLYEKKERLPSNWNADHKRFYTPGSLLTEIEGALPEPNTFRLIYCRDNDFGFDYSVPPGKHSSGCYEIECILQKITPPDWEPIP